MHASPTAIEHSLTNLILKPAVGQNKTMHALPTAQEHQEPDKCSPLKIKKPVVGQNIAMHAFPTARIFLPCASFYLTCPLTPLPV